MVVEAEEEWFCGFAGFALHVGKAVYASFRFRLRVSGTVRSFITFYRQHMELYERYSTSTIYTNYIPQAKVTHCTWAFEASTI